MDEETLKLLTDLHISNCRQGPGSDEVFQNALALSGIDRAAESSIADIGSGTGSATIPLLEQTNATVTAVELLPTFLKKLQARAEEAGVADRLTMLEADMAALPFRDEQFDAIWSEGAVYNIGFAAGVQQWRRFLKPHGVLAVSEITWLQDDIPEPLKERWQQEYSEIATASAKIAILEQSGYTPIGYFTLPPNCWLDEYYKPLQAGFDDFLARNGQSETAQAIVAAEEKEIELYTQYKDYYSYGFYIAKRLP